MYNNLETVIQIKINTLYINTHIINVLKKQSTPINITSNSISSPTFFINLPEFTNLNATLEINDFLSIYNSKINSTTWNMIHNLCERKLILKYIDLSGTTSIERSFPIKESIETLTLSEEPIASILSPKKLYSFISKLEFNIINLSVYKNSLSLQCEELETFNIKFENLESQMKNENKINISIDLKSLISSCNDFDRQLICLFKEFIIIYSYHKDIIMANIINGI